MTATEAALAAPTAASIAAREESVTPEFQISFTRALPVVSKYSSRMRCVVPGSNDTGTVRVPYDCLRQLSIASASSRNSR
jgi:hypothetical protein